MAWDGGALGAVNLADLFSEMLQLPYDKYIGRADAEDRKRIASRSMHARIALNHGKPRSQS